MKKTMLILALALAANLIPELAQGADFNGWSRKAKIQFSGYNPPGGATTLTNFPALVVLSTNISNFSYGDFLSLTNQDLRFTASNGTDELNYEIEKWNTNGSSYVWVQVPRLADTNTSVWAWWGMANTNAPAYTTNGATWSNGCVGVWHLTDGTALSGKDSTSNANTGTLNGPPGATNGVADGAARFSATNQYVTSSKNTGITGSVSRTVSFWINPASTNGRQTITSMGAGANTQSWSIEYNGVLGGPSNIYVFGYNCDLYTTAKLPLNAWSHIAVTYSGGVVSTGTKIYYNGTPQSVTVSGDGTLNTGNSAFSIGRDVPMTRQSFTGAVDEVRIENGVRSSNWVWAAYMNTFTNGAFAGSFNQYGPVELIDPNLPVVANQPAVNIRRLSADLVGSLTYTGTSPTTVYAFWATNDCTTNEATWLANGGISNLGPRVQGEAFTNSLSGLAPDTLYYFNFMASNTTGKAWGSTAGSPSFQTVLATGGNTTNDSGGYRIHTFTNSATAGSFIVNASNVVEVLVVAGGGGGGAAYGGGGGAGGLIYSNVFPVTPGTITVSVGLGGAGGPAANAQNWGTNGGNSVFSNLTAYGGGGGGGYLANTAGKVGGSGGGGAHTAGAGGVATNSGQQGQNGGSAAGGPNYGGGGGGGARTPGTNGTTTAGGKGGAGVSNNISGSWVTYAGGGGGGTYLAGTAGTGGDGGGGNGAVGSANTVGNPGLDGRGGGGGGSGYNTTTVAGGKGGSGIVIVRYLIDPNLPIVVNETAVNFRLNSADLVGSLTSTGTSPTTVYAFWATNDCTTNEAAWLANGGSSNLGPRVQGETFTNTVGGLAGDTFFYFNLMASNTSGKAWGSVAGSSSFRTLTLPVVNNSAGATAVSQYAATLNGNLTTGLTAYVYIYWWTNNASVTNVLDFGAARSQGPFSTNITGLAWGTLYYYQCFASNAAGTAWATAPSNFTTQTPYFRYVTPTGAGTFSGADWGNAASNVQDAVTACVGQVSEIYLKSGIYSNASQLVVSNHPGLTIRGGYVGSGTPGATGSVPSIVTRNTANNIRIFFCTNSTLALDSLTVSNGYASVGSGLYLIASTTTVANCTLVKNGSPARSDGCGIYLSAGSLTVTTSSFVKNGPTTAPGWTAGYGGAIYAANNPTVVLGDTLFDGNGINGYDYTSGGCLYISGGNLQVRNCRFIGNYLSAFYASGILHLNALGSLSISNCVFSNNTVSINSGGGLIYLGGAGANGMQISDCLMMGNTASLGQIALAQSGGSALLKNCVLSGSTGPGIYQSGSPSTVLTNCLIYGFSSHGVQLAAGRAAICNSTIADNLGCGLTNTTAGIAVTNLNSIYWGNTLGGSCGPVTSTYTCAQEVRSGAGNRVEDPLFVAGYYLSANGLAYQSANSPCLDVGSAAASDLGLNNRSTRTDGLGDSGIVDLGYHYPLGAAAVSNMVIYADVNLGSDANEGWTAGAGAVKTITRALSKVLPRGTINVAVGTYSSATPGEIFPLNVATLGITIKGTNQTATIFDALKKTRVMTVSPLLAVSLWLEGVTFANGSNLVAGSGLYAPSCRTTVTNCTFSRNSITNIACSLAGGAIYAASPGSLTVVDSTIVSNGAYFFGTGVSPQGGGIYALNIPVLIDRCVFYTNRVDGYDNARGGSIHLQGATCFATIRNSQFRDNYARGFYAPSAIISVDTVGGFVVSNCVFAGNKVEPYDHFQAGPGGIIGFIGTGVNGMQIVGSTFTNNAGMATANNRTAGQICMLQTGGSLNLKNCVFGNSSAGAGVYKVGTGTMSLENCLIYGQTNGGVISTNLASVMTINKCTFANNTGHGVSNWYATIFVSNSIAWGNSLGGITNCNVSYTCSQEAQSGVGNTNINPRFVDTNYFHLSSRGGQYEGGFFTGGTWSASAVTNSPLIDAGDPASTAWAAETQPNGRRLNLGAYAGTPVASRTFLAEPGVFSSLRVHAYDPTNVGPDFASFNGEILHSGSASEARAFFCYGTLDKGVTDTGLWDRVVDVGTRVQWELFTTNITGLGGTTYYRAYVTNSAGEQSWSSNAIQLGSLAPPTVTNQGAQSVRRRSAVLNGQVYNTDVIQPDCWFYYWVSGAGSSNNVPLGQQSAAFATTVNGLTPGTLYNFKILASNSAGTVWSDVASFTTLDAGARGWYVSQSGANAEGTNWTTAISSVTNAMLIAEPNDSLYLAGGSYNMATQLIWTTSFLTIRGSFAATNDADQPGNNDIARWPTVLYRDYQAPISFRILSISGVTNGTLEQVVISNGRIGSDSGGTYFGAGLFIGNSTNLLISGCQIVSNVCGGYYHTFWGAGLYASNSYGTISNCLVSSNVVNRWYPTAGWGEGVGGGLYVLGGNWTIRDSVFRWNTAGTTYSDAGGLAITNGVVRAVNCLFADNITLNNQAGSGPGSAIVVNGPFARLQMENCTIAGNGGNARGLRTLSGGSAALTNCILWGNNGEVSGTVSLVSCNVQDGTGAGINGTISENPRFERGYYLADGSPCRDRGNMTVAAAGLSGYTAVANGLADTDAVDLGYHRPAGTDVTVNDLYVSTNGSDSVGVTGADAGHSLRTITRALVLARSSSIIHVGAGTYTTNIGEVFPLTLSNVVSDIGIQGAGPTQTIVRGAGLTRILNFPAKGNLLFEGLTLSRGGGALSTGIGLYLGNSGYTTVTNCTIAENTYAPVYGGGIALSGGHLDLFDTTMVSNGWLTYIGWTAGNGGALYAVDAGVTLDNVRLDRNSLYGYDYTAGGIMYVARSTLKISNSRAVGNFNASYYTEGLMALDSLRYLSISNMVFSNNVVTATAGDGYLLGLLGTGFNGLQISDSTFVSNNINPALEGGQIYVTLSGGSVSVQRSTLGSNPKSGIVMGGSGLLGITNSLIYAHTNYGVRVSAGTVSIANSTIVSNKLLGVTNSVGTVSIKNSIVWDNGMGVTNVSVIYSDVQGLTENPATHVISQDPQFVGAITQNYALARSSPCLDSGTNEDWMATGIDLGRNQRKFRGIVDLGAYELIYRPDGGTIFTLH